MTWKKWRDGFDVIIGPPTEAADSNARGATLLTSGDVLLPTLWCFGFKSLKTGQILLWTTKILISIIIYDYISAQLSYMQIIQIEMNIINDGKSNDWPSFRQDFGDPKCDW